MRVVKSIIYWVAVFFRFLRALYLITFRRRSFCTTKLAKYVHGFLDFEDCRFHVCQFQAMNKVSGNCECKMITKGQLFTFGKKKNGN